MSIQSEKLHQNLVKGYLSQHPAEAAKLLNSFPLNDVLRYLSSVPIEISSNIFTLLNPDLAASFDYTYG